MAAALWATVVGTLPAFLTGALGVQLSAELGLGESILGIAFGAFFVTAALSSRKMGSLAERLGATLSLRIAMLFGLAVQLALGAFTRDAATLILLLGAAGLVNALVQPAANLLLVRAVPPSRHGLGFGLKQAAIPTATLLSGLAIPTVALTLGWRWAYILGSGIALLSLALIPRLPTIPARIAQRGSPAVPRNAMGALRVLAASVGCGAAAASSLGAFLVPAGVAAGFSEGRAALILTAGSTLGIVGRVGLGAWADRSTRDPLNVVAGLLASGTLAFALLAAQSPSSHVVGTLLAFGLGWSWPGLFNFAVARSLPDAPAAATGFTQTGTYVGALLGPVLFGWLAEHCSYSAGWLATAFFAACAAALAAWGNRLLAGNSPNASGNG